MNSPQNKANVESQLDRIEALLEQGNALRSEAIALQKQVIEAQRGQIEKASLMTDQAMDLQRRSRPLVKLLLTAIFIVVGLAIYTSFFRR